ncbi:Por secretion system C-terminal sorting domain-containing protein [Tenacibaculum sp. MAR_2009_124]|uniref:agmatine deiminase family protein n=1 Tax=Tenacibaculum sp. MAR_2009_124 TaxID=1250059 RepID=UPI000896E144|nr:agmatine deiminase family protein [Tenacibaculum sp. MAR_2009_124]SEC39704.1 Por secretion system C-terminal sorting domain-containing protein [Tenacibaculum sp. MAR_2009_124]
MRKVKLSLVLLTIIFTNLLYAQQGVIPKEKNLIIEKYKKASAKHQFSSRELDIIYDYLKSQDAKKADAECLQYNKRVPSKEEIKLKKQERKEKSLTRQNTAVRSTPITLPTDARFPGEFEEIQGVFVCYPYKRSGGELRLSENADGSPSFPKFYRDLISAIQQAGVKVYISLRTQADSILLTRHFQEKGTPLSNYEFLINPTDSYWVRDSGPINFYYGTDDKIGWVDLNYGSYRGKDDALTPLWAQRFNFQYSYMPLEFEGGNMIMNGQQSLTTSDRIYKVNSTHSKAEIDQILKESFNLDYLHVLKELTYDGGTGHVDLYIDMLNENHFVYTKQPTEMANIPKYTDYQIVLDNVDYLSTQISPGGSNKPYSFGTVPYPTRDDGTVYDDRYEIGKNSRTYSNHLIVNKSIIQPVFNNGQTGNITNDEKALDIIRKQYPGYRIIPIDGRILKGTGGSVHCLTKEFIAENPVRFKHYPYYGKVDNCQSNYPVDVVITNKSGINRATLFSRIKGSSNWKQTRMTKGSNDHWSSNISLSSNPNGKIIEYYISATSNNGKTMTHPMTGAEGGAYTFWCTSSCSKEVVVNDSYLENFETRSNDWVQDANDNADWQLNSRGNKYLYIDNSASGNNHKAILKSPCFDLSGTSSATFNFKYFLYGSNDNGNILIEASDDNGFTWKRLWKNSGNNRFKWVDTDVSLNAYVGETVQLRITRIMGSTRSSGARIDDLVISTGSNNTSEPDYCKDIPMFNNTQTYQNGDLVQGGNGKVYKRINDNWSFQFDCSTGPSDTEAPTAPRNLVSSNIKQTTVDLSWSASTDNTTVTGYDVYKGSTLIASTASATTYKVMNLTENTSYSFTVKAKDEVGNTSNASNSITVKTLPVANSNDCSNIAAYQGGKIYTEGDQIVYQNKVYKRVNNQWIYQFDCGVEPSDTEAPTAPTDLSAFDVKQTSIQLFWKASTDNIAVTQYEIYQGTNKIGSVGPQTNNLFTVPSLTENTSYNFSVKAKDEAGNTSASSNVVIVKTLTNSNNCANIPAYQGGKVYSEGDQVVHNNKVYEVVNGRFAYQFDCTVSTRGAKVVNAVSNSDIKIYPNPVTTTFSIATDKNLKGASYAIFDSNGRILKRGAYTDNVSISKLNLISGTTYYFKLYVNNEVFEKKFIKK